jgi:hypothetical protein
MKNISPKGILSGTLVFIVLVGLSGLYTTKFESQSINWIILTVLWTIPGYVAASVAGKSGVLNGSVVGVAVGVLTGLITSLFMSPPPGIESSGGLQAGVALGSVAVILCGFGGLLWNVKKYIVSKRL